MEETSLQYRINYHQATWSYTQALSFHGLAVAALAWSRRVFRVQSKRSTGNLQAGVCSGTIHPVCNPNRPEESSIASFPAMVLLYVSRRLETKEGKYMFKIYLDSSLRNTTKTYLRIFFKIN